MDIPTPAMDQILDYQKLTPEVKKWFYIMVIGRSMFDAKTKDKWQIVPFIKGEAGAGKSSILKFMQEMYDPADVGVIDNKVEENFGLSQCIVDKLLIMIDEINGKMSMDQSHFNSIGSTGPLSLPVKGKAPIVFTQYITPLICAGNKLPPYPNDRDNFARRILPFLFDTKILDKDHDSSLDLRLRLERGNIILKALRLYSGVWSKKHKPNYPEYFTTARDMLMDDKDIVISTINNSAVLIVDADAYITQTEFRAMIKNYCGEVGGKFTLNLDSMANARSKKGVSVTPHCVKEYPPHSGVMRRDIYITGVGLRTYFAAPEQQPQAVAAAAAPQQNLHIIRQPQPQQQRPLVQLPIPFGEAPQAHRPT
jgi:hypothetical protein